MPPRRMPPYRMPPRRMPPYWMPPWQMPPYPRARGLSGTGLRGAGSRCGRKPWVARLPWPPRRPCSPPQPCCSRPTSREVLRQDPVPGPNARPRTLPLWVVRRQGRRRPRSWPWRRGPSGRTAGAAPLPRPGGDHLAGVHAGGTGTHLLRTQDHERRRHGIRRQDPPGVRTTVRVPPLSAAAGHPLPGRPGRRGRHHGSRRVHRPPGQDALRVPGGGLGGGAGVERGLVRTLPTAHVYPDRVIWKPDLV